MTPKLFECCDFIVLLSAEARVEEVSWRFDEITAYVKCYFLFEVVKSSDI
jgi:hypothetical protein